MQITNDWIKGYIQALDNIKDYVETLRKDVDNNEIEGLPLDAVTSKAYRTVNNYIEHVKDNYKNLVKELNDSTKN